MDRYDVEIEKKGESKLKFNLCDAQGMTSRIRGAFRMSQFPQLSLKMQQGDTYYSDREPPYASTEQRDFSGGRGWDKLERDKSRFFDSYRAITWLEGLLLPGAEETYSKGIRGVIEQHWFSENENGNEEMNRVDLGTDERYISIMFTPTDNITPDFVYMPIGLDYDIDNWEIEIDIYSDDGANDKPDSKIFGTGLTQPAAYEQIRRLEFSSPSQLNSGTKYHLVIHNSGIGSDAWNEDGYYIGCADTVPTGAKCYRSEDASIWNATTSAAPFYRLVEDDPQFEAFFFEHLGALYAALSFYDGTAPQVFMNGERGTVVSATSTTITDTGAFTSDELVGAIAMLYSGMGSDVDRPWRSISANDANSFTVSEAWDSTPDATTKYVVVHRDKFFEVSGHGMTGRITDICTYGNIVYFARGDFADLYHMYDDTFTIEEGNRATFIEVAPESTTEEMRVYAAKASFPPTVGNSVPTFADDGITITDLSFTDAVAVGDANMEKDDGSWSDVGTPTTHDQHVLARYDGIKGRRVVSDATDEGGGQTINVTAGSTYLVEVWVRRSSGASIQLKFEGTQLDTTSTSSWIKLKGYATVAGATSDIQILSSGITSFSYDAVKITKVETELPVGHNKITGLVVSGDPRRLYVLTESGVLRDIYGTYRDVSPGEFTSARDYRNGAAAAKTGADIYLTFLDNVVKYSDEDISIIGPNRDEGLPEERRGQIRDMKMYGEWLLCALDGGEDNISSILLYNKLGWHEFYRAPAGGMRITSLFVQPMPGEYCDRIWFNEGADLVYCHIDQNPEKNDNFRYTWASWIAMASVYGSMSEVDKFFHSIKVISEDIAAGYYVSLAPRDPDGYDVGTTPPAGETVETLWGSLNTADDAPVGENRIDEFYGMDYFTLRRLQIHIGLHNDRPTRFVQVRGVVVDYLEHIPISWSYSMRLVTSDSRKSLAGEGSKDLAEDDLNTLKGYVNDAEPVRITTPFGFASSFQAKLTSITDIIPLGYQRKSEREKVMFTLTAVDA